MANFDAHKNLALGIISVAPTPGISGTSLILGPGYAALFPATPFNCTVYPSDQNPSVTNAEIVRVTNITGDVFTIVRAQEGTSAINIKPGYAIANTISVKVITDIENAVNSISSSVSSMSGAGILSLSAGTTNATGPQIVFSNSNGVSFGVAGNTVTAQFAAGGGGVGISAGAESQSSGTVIFSNSNNVSFGLSNNGVMTASVNVGVAPGSISAGTTSASLGQIVFSNANNVSFGMSGQTVTASIPGGAAAGSISAGTTSASLGQVVFSNSNGISFGMNAGSVTASHNALTSQSNQAFSAAGGSSAFQTLSFANGNGFTFSNSNGSVQGSYTVPSTAGLLSAINFSAGTTSNNGSAFVFSNSNGVSFGLNGSTVTASVSNAAQSTQPVAASASNGSFLFSTLGFSNANGVTFGTSAGSIITASIPAGAAAGSISAGTASFALGQVVFSNSNNVTFGLNGGTVTASIPSANAATLSISQIPGPFGNNTALQSYSVVRMVLDPMPIPCNISFNYLQNVISATNSFGNASVSTNTSTTQNIVMSFGIYSRSVTDSAATNFSNSSIIVTHATQSWGLSISTSGSSSSKAATYAWNSNSTGGTTNYTVSANSASMNVPGAQQRILLGIPWSLNLTPGDYWLGRVVSTNPAFGAPFFASFVEMTFNANSTNLSSFGDTQGGNNNGNNMVVPGLGFYTVNNITAFPTSLNLINDILNSNFGGQLFRYYVLKP